MTFQFNFQLCRVAVYCAEAKKATSAASLELKTACEEFDRSNRQLKELSEGTPKTEKASTLASERVAKALEVDIGLVIAKAAVAGVKVIQTCKKAIQENKDALQRYLAD